MKTGLWPDGCSSVYACGCKGEAKEIPGVGIEVTQRDKAMGG